MRAVLTGAALTTSTDAVTRHVIEAQNGRSGVKCRLRLPGGVGQLRIPHPAGEQPIGARVRRGVEVSQQNGRVGAIRMADPFAAQERRRLSPPLPRAQRQVSIDHLDRMPLDLDRDP